MSIADIERKKTEIWADHIHRCHDAELSEAEKWILQELDWEIKRLRRETNEHTDGRLNMEKGDNKQRRMIWKYI